MTTSPSSRPHRRRLALLGAIAGAGLALAAPLAASAHVGVSPDESPAGTTSVLTFSFSHGCEESPTTALVFDIPEGVESTTPVLAAGWTISTERADDGSLTQVTYTVDEPVPSGIRASLELAVRFSADAAESSVSFPVTQVCEEGENAWTQTAADGQDPESLDAPAPVVAVEAVAEDGHDHHDVTETAGADSDEHASDEHASEEHAADSMSADATDANGALALGLGSAGVVLGAAGLVFGVLALRRARS